MEDNTQTKKTDEKITEENENETAKKTDRDIVK
jgi:hypothetical protein